MTQPTMPEARTLATVLFEKAAQAPDHLAIIHGDERITYGELAAMVRQRAAGLLALRVEPGDRLAILLGNEPEWIAMALAASAVGATLAPLNTWYKPGELAWTLRHCRIRFAFVQHKFLKTDYGEVFADLLAQHELPDLEQVFLIGGERSGLGQFGAVLEAGRSIPSRQVDEAALAVDPGSTAYVLYTSGSTADPKGVRLTHRGLVVNGFELGQRRAIGPDDRTWIGTPLFYALGAANALPATLTAGATVVLQGAFEAGAALDVIESVGATVYYGTGNMSRALIDHPSFSLDRVATLTKGNAGLGAEYKRLTLVEMQITGAVPAYGLTETYGNAAVGSHDDPLEVKLATDGMALPGQEIVIVDPDTDRRLPAGEVGLVLVRGNVTPGYLDNPEETAKAIRTDGFFDTGDLGSLDDAGRLRFHSRLKDVIKTGGINVSPIEVEQVLAQHPAVRDAHVVGVPDAVKGEVIAAFVDPLEPVDEAELCAFVKERAASFKVPHHVFFRSESELPRLATGKIAKVRLKQEAAELLGA